MFEILRLNSALSSTLKQSPTRNAERVLRAPGRGEKLISKLELHPSRPAIITQTKVIEKTKEYYSCYVIVPLAAEKESFHSLSLFQPGRFHLSINMQARRVSASMCQNYGQGKTRP